MAQYFAGGPAWSLAGGGVPAAVEGKLARLARYQDGWAGNGRSFSDAVVREARMILMAGFGSGQFQSADVFPGRHGQIVVTFYRGRQLYDFEVAPGQTVRVSRELDDEDCGEPVALSYASAVGVLLAIGTDLWTLFSFLSRMTTSQRNVGSRAQPLNPTQGTLMVSQYSMRPADLSAAGAFASMRARGIDRQYKVTLLSSTSGDALPHRSPPATEWKTRRATPETPAIATSVA